MALTLNAPDQNPVTGTSGAQVKPITDGTKVVVVENQRRRTGFWGALDDLGTTVVNGVSGVAGAIAQKEVDSLITGSESSPDRTGDPFDQIGRVEVPQESFLEKYKVELYIGGGVVAALIVFLAVKK